MTRLLITVAAALTLAATLTGCGTPEADPGVAVTVRFNDSSVPPPHHRSWEVVLDADSMSLVVDSYGDEITRRQVPMPAADWERYVADLPDALDEIGTDDVGDVCPGGTSLELDVASGGDDVDRGLEVAPSCGEDDAEELAERVEALVEPFRDDLGLDAAIAS